MERKKGGLRFDWFVSLMVVVCLYFAYNIIQQQSHLNAIEKNRSDVQVMLDQARQKNQALTAEKQGLESYEYIEKVAREDLGMARQGELPYISAKH